MCGITGLVAPSSSTPVSRNLLEAMTQTLSHRGPDGDGFWVGEGVGLGHRRLAVIDQLGGAQPMAKNDGQVILTFNGEIYNFKNLRQRLADAGHVFETRCDTEVLLAAYLEWGEECLEHLWGMFAFAIWDNRKKQLFAARDRLGIKPLYWGLDIYGHFAFGSEMKALLAMPSFSRRLRADAVEDFLSLGYVPDPKSILTDIHKLAPGHYLTYKHGDQRPTIRRYWQPTIDPVLSGLEAETQLLDKLDGAVRMRMVADVPVGAFLSGGMDSSAIVALMSRHAHGALETCTMGHEDDERDESGYAAMIAEQYLTHHRLRFSTLDDMTLLDMIPDLFDEPFSDVSALPTYRVSGLARERVTVALSGDGADELFGGYRRYRYHLAEQEFRDLVPGALRKALIGPIASLYPKMDWAPRFLRAKSTLEGMALPAYAAYFNSVAKIPDRDRYFMMGNQLKSDLSGYRTVDHFKAVFELIKDVHPLTQIQYMDLHSYLPGDILTKVDRTSMAHSLEVRLPFLDHRMVDFAFSIDPRAHIRWNQGKHVLRSAFGGVLPAEILDRRKQGFTVPMGDWLNKGESSELDELISSERLYDLGIFDKGRLKSMIKSHRSGRRNYESALWSALVLNRCMERLNVTI